MSGEQAYEVCAWEQGLLGRDTTIKGRIGWKGYTTDDLRNSGPWVIGGTSVNSVPRIGLETAKHLSREKYLESPEIQLKHGDLLVVTRGNLADVALFDGSIGEATINPSIVILSDFDGEPRFLFYYLISPIGRASLLSIASGSSVPAIYQADLKKLKYLKPPLPEQRRIAKILGDLDDKIELNRKMNETLEQMARALFKSWFVDFDPVRAKMEGRTPTGIDAATAALFPDRLVDSELGPIPEGWEVAHIGDVVEVFDSKRIPLSGREREQRQGPYPYHGAASVMDYVDDYLFDGVYALMGEDGSVITDDGMPVMQYVWGKFWVNNHAHVLRGKNGVSTEHLLLHLQGSNIAAFVTGAVQLKLSQGNMNRIPFLLPTRDVSEAFARTIDPLFTQIRANKDQSRTLSTLRDTLLPKLVSGEVRVGG